MQGQKSVLKSERSCKGVDSGRLLSSHEDAISGFWCSLIRKSSSSWAAHGCAACVEAAALFP